MSEKSKAYGRSLSVLWPCALLALVLTAHAAQGQGQPTVQQGSPNQHLFRLPTTLHHVKGRLKMGRCDASLRGWRLKVTEYWYLMNGQDRLVSPNGWLIDTSGARVEQGRALGEVNLTDPGGDFDVQWREVAIADRVPWRSNVMYEDSDQLRTAYRVLSLELIPEGPFFAQLTPVPSVTFFGTENVKHVGELKIICQLIGG